MNMYLYTDIDIFKTSTFLRLRTEWKVTKKRKGPWEAKGGHEELKGQLINSFKNHLVCILGMDSKNQWDDRDEL